MNSEQCSSYSFLQSRVLLAPSGHMLRITGIYIFLTQCSPYSHCQSSVHLAHSSRYSSRPRCYVACGLMVSSPEPCASSGGRLPEAFFLVSDWTHSSPKVQKRVNLVDLVKSFQTSPSIYLPNLALIQPKTGLSKFAKKFYSSSRKLEKTIRKA